MPLPLLSLLLASSSVLAGGSSISMATTNHRKRSIEYVAIYSYTDSGIHYCLKNFGASMAGLTQCNNIDMSNKLQVFELVSSSVSNKYHLRSPHDGLCVDFTDFNQLWFNMVNCNTATFNGQKPYVFNWNSAFKADSGTGVFDAPKYAVLSSPNQGFTSGSDLDANKCYTSNSFGGLDLLTCQNKRSMTWFAKSTYDTPDSLSEIDSYADSVCNSRHSTNPSLYACDAVPKGIVIRGTSGANGKLLRTSDKFIPHVRVSNNMEISFTFFLNSYGAFENVLAISSALTTSGNEILVGFNGNKAQVVINGAIYTSSAAVPTGTYVKMSVMIYSGSQLQIELKIRNPTTKVFDTFNRQFAIPNFPDSHEYYFSSPSSLSGTVADANVGPIRIKHYSGTPENWN